MSQQFTSMTKTTVRNMQSRRFGEFITLTQHLIQKWNKMFVVIFYFSFIRSLRNWSVEEEKKKVMV